MKPPASNPGSRARAAASSAGFTLMELMITVAIVGILAAIAYPSYVAYVHRADRTDATNAMFSDAQMLQRCYSQTYDYTQCLSTFTPAPAGVTQVSATANSPDGYYSITVAASAADLYTITATPVAGTPQASDSECTKFTLASSGLQGATGTDSSQQCWGSN